MGWSKTPVWGMGCLQNAKRPTRWCTSLIIGGARYNSLSSPWNISTCPTALDSSKFHWDRKTLNFSWICFPCSRDSRYSVIPRVLRHEFKEFQEGFWFGTSIVHTKTHFGEEIEINNKKMWKNKQMEHLVHWNLSCGICHQLLRSIYIYI